MRHKNRLCFVLLIMIIIILSLVGKYSYADVYEQEDPTVEITILNAEKLENLKLNIRNTETGKQIIIYPDTNDNGDYEFPFQGPYGIYEAMVVESSNNYSAEFDEDKFEITDDGQNVTLECINVSSNNVFAKLVNNSKILILLAIICGISLFVIKKKKAQEKE